MSYTYDIYLNFNDVPYDFYDWNKTDSVIHIKKIPIFKISVDNFKNFVKYNIKVDEKFSKCVHNRTEVWNKQSNALSCALFTDNENVIGLMFDESGYSIKKSFLQLDEELEILDDIDDVDNININYEVIKQIKYSTKTRYQIKSEKFITKELNLSNEERLKYIYYECFGKNEMSKNTIIKKIKTIPENSPIYENLYNILKLTK